MHLPDGGVCQCCCCHCGVWRVAAADVGGQRIESVYWLASLQRLLRISSRKRCGEDKTRDRAQENEGCVSAVGARAFYSLQYEAVHAWKSLYQARHCYESLHNPSSVRIPSFIIRKPSSTPGDTSSTFLPAIGKTERAFSPRWLALAQLWLHFPSWCSFAPPRGLLSSPAS